MMWTMFDAALMDNGSLLDVLKDVVSWKKDLKEWITSRAAVSCM